MDSQRNCISNVRPAGLDFPQAAHKLAWLLEQAFNRRLTGVALKDESGELASLMPDAGSHASAEAAAGQVAATNAEAPVKKGLGVDVTPP